VIRIDFFEAIEPPPAQREIPPSELGEFIDTPTIPRVGLRGSAMGVGGRDPRWRALAGAVIGSGQRPGGRIRTLAALQERLQRSGDDAARSASIGGS
jgi:hypothetical protein